MKYPFKFKKGSILWRFFRYVLRVEKYEEKINAQRHMRRKELIKRKFSKNCEATKQRYDHTAVREKMAPDEIEKVMRIAYNQYRQAAQNEPIDCAGVGCARKRRLIYMYRCWFCGQYFCPVCARIHFGDRS